MKDIESATKVLQTCKKKFPIYPMAIFIGVAVFFLCEVYHLNSTNRWIDRTDKAIYSVNDIQKQLGDLESSFHAFLITGNKKFLEVYNHDRGLVLDEIRGLKLSAANPLQQERVNQIEKSVQDWLRFSNESMEAKTSGRNINSFQSEKKSKVLLEPAYAKAKQMIRAELDNRGKKMAFTKKTADYSIIIGGVAFLCMGGLIAYIFRRRKIWELALSESEERFRCLVSSAPDTIFIFNSAGSIEFINEKGANNFGYGQGELIGKPIERLIPRCRANELFHEGDVKPFGFGLELVGRKKGGVEFPVDVSLNLINLRKGPIVMGILRDICERKRIEEREHFLANVSEVLSESLSFNTTLEKLARLALPIIADWCVVDVFIDTGAAKRIIGIHSDPSKRHLIERFRELGPSESSTRGTMEAMRSGKPILINDVTEEQLLIDTASEERARLIVELGAKSYMIIPLRARDMVIGALSFTSASRNYSTADLNLACELGRRASLSIDNARLYEEAQKEISVREDMVAIVSHDLRGPLTAIRLGAQLVSKILKDGGPTDVRKKIMIESIKRIERTTDRVSRLVDDLLDQTKAATGRFPLERTFVDAGEIVLKTVEMLKPLAEEKGVRLTAQVEECSFQIKCDGERLSQVLSNLIGNAIKFTPESGEAKVIARGDSDGIHFSVVDDGIGISNEDISHIFDRYWHARKARRTGAGLGLSIAKAIVEAHHGRIWVKSCINAGTEFHFVIPYGEENVLVADENRTWQDNAGLPREIFSTGSISLV